MKNSLSFADRRMCVAMCGFTDCERGGISLDWLGLVAGILLLGMMLVYGIFNDGVSSTSGSVNENLRNARVIIDTDPRPQPGIFQ